jgi:hypothetical protein
MHPDDARLSPCVTRGSAAARASVETWLLRRASASANRWKFGEIITPSASRKTA